MTKIVSTATEGEAATLMGMKWLKCNAYRLPARHVFAVLLVLSVVACSQGRDEIAYSMLAEISGGPTVEHVAVRFVDVPFYWEWGAVGEGGWKRYSDIEPRQVPRSLVLYWEKNGEKFEMPFAIDMPTPEMVESIRASGVNVNGRFFKSDLELRFEISPDQNTARVYWHEDKMPAASPPKEQAGPFGRR